MKILVRMPNWLGDAVMATPALANLWRHHPDGEIVLVGSPIVAQLFRPDPRLRAVVVDATRSTRGRTWKVAQLGAALGREYGPFDLGIALPNSLSSRLLLLGAGARHRAGRRKRLSSTLLTHRIAVDPGGHQAEIYNEIVNAYLQTNYETGPTSVYVEQPHIYNRPTAGINPGAAYGSAKRWPPQRFAEVGRALADSYDLVIFGGPAEVDMASEIEGHLREVGVVNFENIAGQTSVTELAARLAGLHLMITNDSGPMHLAGAFGVPTTAVFGATNHVQTCQWRAKRLAIVRRDLECAPCMRRVCPLGHHACMEQIEASEVVDAALRLVA